MYWESSAHFKCLIDRVHDPRVDGELRPVSNSAAAADVWARNNRPRRQMVCASSSGMSSSTGANVIEPFAKLIPGSSFASGSSATSGSASTSSVSLSAPNRRLHAARR